MTEHLTAQEYKRLARREKRRFSPGLEARLQTKMPPPPRTLYDNKWEEQYAVMLDLRHKAGEVSWWRAKPFTLRISERGSTVRYTPDFALIEEKTVPEWAGGASSFFVVVEIKGRRRKAGMMRYRLARDLFPFWTWRMEEMHKGAWREVKL